MHVTDIDPNRPGLEIFTVHEGATYAPYGYALRDAATGEVIYGEYSGKDTGRGMIGDIDPAVLGIETWATRLRSASGESLGATYPGTNQSIRWAADGTTQIVNGAGDADVTVDSFTQGRLLTAVGTRSNNGTKGTASLVADVFGDWREELLVRTEDSSAIRIYLSTEVTTHKLHTLMHDPQYRAEIARQNTAYNQPAYTSFYLASDMDFSDVPMIPRWLPGSAAALGRSLAGFVDAGEVSGPVAKQLTAAAEQAARAVEAGKAASAEKAVQKFLRFLDQHKKPDHVSDAAHAALAHAAETLLGELRA
jgi:hypothetical protein